MKIVVILAMDKVQSTLLNPHLLYQAVVITFIFKYSSIKVNQRPLYHALLITIVFKNYCSSIKVKLFQHSSCSVVGQYCMKIL